MDSLENKILRLLNAGVPTETGHAQTTSFSLQYIAEAIGADASEVEKALIAMESSGQVHSVPADAPPTEQQWSID